MEYRKDVPLDPNTDYWFVDMGELFFMNGGSSHAFPTEAAARKFALNQMRIAKKKYGVDRKVSIRYPDGTIKEVK